MKDEIKEILDRLDYNEWEVDLYKVPIQWSELYDIRDYITNLQEECHRHYADSVHYNNLYIDEIKKNERLRKELELCKKNGKI